MTQKERQERSQREIRLAAMEEFGTRNYSEVSMEQICSRHHISKGMMYHYFSNRDELFLLCAGEVFTGLGQYLEKHLPSAANADPASCTHEFLLLREAYFQERPLERNVFNNALFHSPEHLKEQIRLLRRPLHEMNLAFFQQIVSRLPLRSQVTARDAVRYFESIEYVFWDILSQFDTENAHSDLSAFSTVSEKVLDMVFFGIARQPEGRPAEG